MSHTKSLDGQVVFCCDFCDTPYNTAREADECYYNDRINEEEGLTIEH